MPPAPHPKQKPDVGLWLVGILFGTPAVLVLAWLVWLFVSTVFLGEGSACPQNSC
jgi:ABC-type Co2+ transport system permease subunit